MSRTSYVWNSVPGALSIFPEYSQSLTDYPFYWRPFDYNVEDAFTAVIYATNRNALPSSPVYRLIRALSGSAYLKKVFEYLQLTHGVLLLCLVFGTRWCCLILYIVGEMIT